MFINCNLPMSSFIFILISVKSVAPGLSTSFCKMLVHELFPSVGAMWLLLRLDIEDAFTAWDIKFAAFCNSAECLLVETLGTSGTLGQFVVAIFALAVEMSLSKIKNICVKHNSSV